MAELLEMLEINGDSFEGGGEIIRTALALSAITGRPFKAYNIRKGREVPGLKAQHCSCIDALKQLCNATAENCEEGSTELTFIPKKIEGKNIRVDIGTAGSVTLLLQSLLLPALFADKDVKIKITGGTDVSWSSPIDYFSNVFLPQINKYSESIKFQLNSRGYYPKGMGDIELRIKQKYKLSEYDNFNEFLKNIRQYSRKINLTKNGNLIQIKGISHSSKDLLQQEVAERQAKKAKLILAQLNCPISITTEYCTAQSIGSGITLWARFSINKDEYDEINPIIIGSSSLGEKNKRSETVGEEAANELIRLIKSQSPIDSHLADQLVPFIAIFGGELKTEKITQHILANAYVCELFLGKCLEIDEKNETIKSIF